MEPPLSQPLTEELARWLAEILDQHGCPPLDESEHQTVFEQFVRDVDEALVGEERDRVLRAGYLAMRSSALGRGVHDADQ